MQDPIGSQGIAQHRATGDVDLAFEGGLDFVSRVNLLQQKKAEYEQALIALRLGTTAKDAFDQSREKLKEADAAQKAAAAILADARAKAAELVQDAQGQVMHLKTDAQKEAEQKVAEAEAVRKRTLREADDIRKEATATLASAKQAQKDASAANAAAQAATAAHRKAEAAFNADAAENAATAAKYHAKIERLNSILAAELASESR